MKYALILLIICLEGIVYAQNKPKIDSLRKELHQTYNDTTCINLYQKIGDQYETFMPDTALFFYKQALELTDENLQCNYNTGKEEVIGKLQHTLLFQKAMSFYKIGLVCYNQCKHKKSMEYFERSLILSKELENKKMMAILYNCLGYIHKQQHIYTDALECFNKSLKLYEILDNREKIALAHNNIGTIYYRQGKYEEAIKQYEKSLKIWDEYGNEHKISALYNNISLVHYEIGNYEKAIYYFEKALFINKKFNDQKRVCVIYNNLGATFIKQGNNEKGMEYYSESLKLARRLKDSLTIANTLSNIAGIYIDMNKTSKALEYVTESLKINRAINNKLGISITLSNISFLYNKQHNHYKSVEYALQALQVAREIDALAQEKDASLNLFEAYQGLNDFENALKYMKLNYKLGDSLLNEEKNNTINEIIIKYETKKKQEEYELLLKENEIQNYKLSRSIHVAITIAGILLLIILISILIYRQYKNKTKIEILELEQKLYRAQINPRFIFNSLSLLKDNIINNAPMEACTFLAGFAKYMRLILENSCESFILLEKELQTIEHYFKLQNKFLDNKFSYSFYIDKKIDTKDWIIPPMLMQPFIVIIIERMIRQKNKEGSIFIRNIFKENYIVFDVDFFRISQLNSFEIYSDAINLIKKRLNHINKLAKSNLKLSFNEIPPNGNKYVTTRLSVEIPYFINV